MKTYLVYGFGITLANAVLTLGLYFAGYHSDPAKIGSAQWIISAGSFLITVTGIVLGTKARRAEWPAHENFSYGSALGAGVMIVLFTALFSMVTNYIYFALINPGLTDLMVQSQVAKFEAKGMSSAQIEQVEKGIRAFSRPPIQAALGFIGGMIFGTVISLITSAFLQRQARDQFAGSS